MCLTRFHVMPQDGQWRVVRIGEVFRSPYRTQDEAIRAAQVLALLSEPSQVLIYDLAGHVEAGTVYAAGTPHRP